MAIDLNQLASDLGGMIDDLPGQVTVGSTTFDAGFGPVSKDETMTMTGDIQSIEFRVIFPKSRLAGAPIPKEGDRVKAKAPGQEEKSCRVGEVITPEDGKSLILELTLDRRNPIPR